MYKLPQLTRTSDCDLLKTIFQKLKIDSDSVGFERLGNVPTRNKVKSQPLLLRFGKHEDAILFLKNKRLLPKGSFANFDRTKEQRLKYNNMKKHMLLHNKQNPSHQKFIKFVRGEPALFDRQLKHNSEAPLIDVITIQDE